MTQGHRLLKSAVYQLHSETLAKPAEPEVRRDRQPIVEFTFNSVRLSFEGKKDLNFILGLGMSSGWKIEKGWEKGVEWKKNLCSGESFSRNGNSKLPWLQGCLGNEWRIKWINFYHIIWIHKEIYFQTYDIVTVTYWCHRQCHRHCCIIL